MEPESTMRRTGVLAALSALLSGCSATRALDALVPADTYRGEQGLAYGPDPRQRLDTYLPLQPAPDAPLVVFFYGGSWTRGSRADYRFVGEALASAGAAAVVADYRLSPQVRWRAILADCAAATRWAFDHARELGASGRRVFVMGHSAGGYNAAMLALDARWLAAQQLAPRRLAGWIGIAGAYDFLPIGDRDTRVAFDWPDTPADSQPIAHVSPAAPPALLIAPERDSVVSVERSTLGLGRRLQAAGAAVRVRVFPELSHPTAIGALARPLRWLAPVREEVLAFLHTGPNGPLAPGARPSR
jgi:acetyl esterase/lipase